MCAIRWYRGLVGITTVQPGVHSETCPTAKMEFFVKVVKRFQPLTAFAKSSQNLRCLTWSDSSHNVGSEQILILLILCLAQKMKNFIKDFFSKFDQLVTFTENILNGKLFFFCSGQRFAIMRSSSNGFGL